MKFHNGRNATASDASESSGEELKHLIEADVRFSVEMDSNRKSFLHCSHIDSCFPKAFDSSHLRRAKEAMKSVWKEIGGVTSRYMEAHQSESKSQISQQLFAQGWSASAQLMMPCFNLA